MGTKRGATENRKINKIIIIKIENDCEECLAGKHSGVEADTCPDCLPGKLQDYKII